MTELALNYFTDKEVGRKSDNHNTALIHAYKQPNDQGDILTSFLNTLSNKMLLLKKAGLERIVVHVNLAYTGQCNWEINPTQLMLLVKLEAAFTITAYESTED